MLRLPIFVDVRDRPVVLLGEGSAAEAKARLLRRAGARLVDEATQASLAIVAIEDDADAEAAVARLRARGLLVNAVDRPHLCDFTLPAIVDRDPVLIAIGTAGRSAGLAKALRQRLELLLPATLGRLADALHAARPRLRARWPDADARRHALDDGLSPGGLIDPLGNPAHVDEWLAQSGPASAPALVRIRLRSDDPDDLTLREARWLGSADRIYHRVGTPAAVLDRARADAGRIEGSPPSELPPGLSVAIE